MSKASKMFVTAYGTWGMEEFQVFNVDNWTEKDFDKLDAESDYNKLELARKITRKRNKQAKKAKKAQEWCNAFDAQFPEVRTFIIGEDGVTEIK